MGVFEPIFFIGLYSNPEDQTRINLMSGDFYLDVMKHYIENETSREKLLSGLKFLAVRVKDVLEIDEIIRIWERERISLMLNGVRLLKVSSTELCSGFISSVTEILETRKLNIFEGRSEKIERLREKVRKSKIIIESRAKTPKTSPKSQPQHEIDYSKILDRIKFIKGKKFKKKIETVLEEVKNRNSKLNNKNFATIALIIFKTAGLLETPTFKKWLEDFSEAFGRLPTKYRPNQLEENIDNMVRKYYFLDDFPGK